MKRILTSLFFLSVLLTACTTTSAPEQQASPTPQPVDEPTLAPYEDDTPAPPRLDAPIVESPSLVFIHFINSLDGWGVTETKIVRTNDGGLTWYDFTPPQLTAAGYSVNVFFLDTIHGWVQVPDFTNYPNGGFLYRTTDGGTTWLNSETPFSGSNLQFLDANNGWVLADLGVATGSNAVAVYQTTDGGTTWVQRFINDPNNPNAGDSLPLGGLKAGIAPVNMQTAFIYGVTYSLATPYLFRTDDSGVTWSEVTLPLPVGIESFELSIDQDQMEFVSATDGFIAMRLTGDFYQLAIYITRDGGNSWTLTATPIPEGGSADFLSAEEMVIYNGKQFYVTRDAARTWSIIPPDIKFDEVFAGMDFTTPGTGWVVTLDPNNHRSLYRTGDGGMTWFPVFP